MENSMQDVSCNGKTKPTLLFVYNADTGLFSVMTDYAHKILSPKTYPCNLCAITYGNMGMNKKWKEYIDNLTISIEFLHRDEFLKRYDLKNTQLPAAFIKKGDNIAVLIDHSEINGCTSVEELMDLVTMKIKNVG
ncbi:MAG: hypothetical protein KAJ00_04910 [Deltaproteobacteria bacterium]|nr:hypothetical protein [Deltaproteobacteria bacterium]